MRAEVRYTGDGYGGSKPRGLVIQAENAEESEMLDEVFGSRVGPDGLIGTREAECRLADGYGEHYVYISAEKPHSQESK